MLPLLPRLRPYLPFAVAFPGSPRRKQQAEFKSRFRLAFLRVVPCAHGAPDGQTP